MQLIEEYEELIERDSTQISILWKATQIFFYFLSTITGYCCAIIFYIFWVDIFGEHCPLWANVYMISKVIGTDSKNDCKSNEIFSKTTGFNYDNWFNRIIVRYNHKISCESYYFISLCSCIFGIVWIALFAVCGKGGYDIRIIIAPWRIVMPALAFNFVFMIVTIYAAHNLEGGFNQFRFDIWKLFSELTKDPEPVSNQIICDIIQKYGEMYTSHKYNVCNLFITLEVLTWIMAWSWTIGLIILVIRILVVVDFRLLKVMIYEIPPSSMTLPTDDNINHRNKQSESENEEES